MIEMQASRSRAFLDWAAPVIKSAFDGSGEGWGADNLYRLATQVAEVSSVSMQTKSLIQRM